MISLVYIDRKHASATEDKFVIVFDGANLDWTAAGPAPQFERYNLLACVYTGADKNHWEWMAYYSDADCTIDGLAACSDWTCDAAASGDSTVVGATSLEYDIASAGNRGKYHQI